MGGIKVARPLISTLMIFFGVLLKYSHVDLLSKVSSTGLSSSIVSDIILIVFWALTRSARMTSGNPKVGTRGGCWR